MVRGEERVGDRGTGKVKIECAAIFMEGGCELRCVQIARKGLRQILTKLRGGTAELRVKPGRCIVIWVGLEEQIEFALTLPRVSGGCGALCDEM